MSIRSPRFGVIESGYIVIQNTFDMGLEQFGELGLRIVGIDD